MRDWLATASGSYSLTAVATDNMGEITTSSPVSLTLNSSTTTYIHTDFLGSPIVGTSESGGIAWNAHYAPFGERLDTSATERLGYTGQPFDTESQLAYHGARYYDPTIGRFYGIDPVEVDAEDLYTFNRYSYANNRPYSARDTSGRFTCVIQEDCDRFEILLSAAKGGVAASAGITDEEKARLALIFDTYGYRGEPGVSVSFDSSIGALGIAQRNVDGSDSIAFNFDMYRSNQGAEATIIHEGQHAVDDKERGRDLASLSERSQTEHNAYTSEAIFNRATGGPMNFESMTGNGYDQNAIDAATQRSISGACENASGDPSCTDPPQPQPQE